MIVLRSLLIAWIAAIASFQLQAQGVKAVQFCGNSVNDTTGEISLFLKLLDGTGKPVTTLDERSIKDCLSVFEDGKTIQERAIRKVDEICSM